MTFVKYVKKLKSSERGHFMPKKEKPYVSILRFIRRF